MAMVSLMTKICFCCSCRFPVFATPCPDPTSIPSASAHSRWRAGWYCKCRWMRNQKHGEPVSYVIGCSGGDGDWSAESDQNASADPHVRQVEVVLPGGAVVGDLPLADDRRAVVAE